MAEGFLVKCDCDHCDCPAATTEGTCYECARGLHVTGWIGGEPTRAEIMHQEGMFPEEKLGTTPYPGDKPGWTDDETGKAAALVVNRDLIERHWQVLIELLENGPSTVDAICAKLGCSHNHIAPRMTELKHAGLVVDTGERRLTRANCQAKVWAISEPGKAAVRAIQEEKRKARGRD